MLEQNIPAPLVVDAALLVSVHTTDGVFLIEECNRFRVLPFPILYNKVEFGIIGIDQKPSARRSVASQKVKGMLS